MKKIYLITIAICISFSFLCSVDAQNEKTMLNSLWHQNAPFNNMIPNKIPAGCGPIAVSQILYHYKAPSHGYGHVTLYNDLDYAGKSIDYGIILNDYSGNYTDAQAEAVANLVWHVGAAMTVKYPNNSSATENNRMVWGLQKYLHVSQKCRFRLRKYYSTRLWLSMLDDQLQSGRPVYYRGRAIRYGGEPEGAGHIFVIDGKNSEGLYHINFGHASTKENKYVSLDVINQSSGNYPGDYGVYYNWVQGMATDLFPDEQFDEGTFNDYPVFLVNPIVLNNDKYIDEIDFPIDDSFSLSMELQVYNGTYIREKEGSLGTWQLGLGLFKADKLLQVISPLQGQSLLTSESKKTTLSWKIPYSLENGEYDIRIITRRIGEEQWQLVWDVAPNTIHAKVHDGHVTLKTMGNHTLQTNLYLLKSIKDIGDVLFKMGDKQEKGKLFSLKMKNPTDNNFENKIKFQIKVDGAVQVVYEQNASVYSDTEIEYRFLIPYTVFDFQNYPNYEIEASYYEQNDNEYIKLTTEVPDLTSMQKIEIDKSTSRISIYDMRGLLVKQTEITNVDPLEGLARGCYIIKGTGMPIKVIKR